MKLPKDATPLWRFLYVIATLVRWLFLRLRVEGRENVPEQGGCIYAINHTMGPDYVIVGYASPRQVYYMAKSELFTWNPLLTWLITAAGAFPVRRGQGDTQAIEQAVKMVRSGKVVGMFPEGTRSRTGKLQRGKTGVARIAMMAQAPIVPVILINSELVLRDLFRLKPRPRVTVRFGKPIDPTGDVNNPEDVRRLTTRVMLAMAEMLPPERRGYYADPGAVMAEEIKLDNGEAGR
uniref:1-acyl-sn-glycerol-3-phosphate acyltransferase n=1 Tax=Caldilinea aerophila TaxID=133453 RepID=A0A7C1JMX3_9CHLR